MTPSPKYSTRTSASAWAFGGLGADGWVLNTLGIAKIPLTEI